MRQQDGPDRLARSSNPLPCFSRLLEDLVAQFEERLQLYRYRLRQLANRSSHPLFVTLSEQRIAGQ